MVLNKLDEEKLKDIDGGWYQRITNALSGWTNLSDIGIPADGLALQ